jgi:hypothetical protein
MQHVPGDNAIETFIRNLAATSLVAAAPSPAQFCRLTLTDSDVIVERKIAHFGSPVEWRRRCIK